jgi:hypothetical protein
LVVLTSEFGRTPDINQNVGRDHYPKAFSAVMFGGGVKGGSRYGKTDKEGREVIEDKIKIQDLNASIAYALVCPWTKSSTAPASAPSPSPTKASRSPGCSPDRSPFSNADDRKRGPQGLVFCVSATLLRDSRFFSGQN